VRVEKLARLEDYETAVIKENKSGLLRYVRGPAAFFMEPFCELMSQTWSTGLAKNKKSLNITRFDSRPHFMWYEFTCRTKDNVEICLGVTL
jgi:hypothetical protein